MTLRKLIRQIIKESLILEKYKEGDIMLSSFPSASQDLEDYDDEEVYNYDNSKSDSPAPAKQQQKNTPLDLSPDVNYEDKNVKENKVQLKEGFEVSKSGNKQITIKDLKNNKSNNYNIKYLTKTVEIKKIELVSNGTDLEFQMTAKAFNQVKTAVMEEQNKKDIMKNFLLDTPEFDITGKDTKGKSATVTFIKI